VDRPLRRRLELAGWILFLVGCVLFLFRAAQLRDILNVAGSGLFVLGVVAFLLARQ
jgi:hypothetical protein